MIKYSNGHVYVKKEKGVVYLGISDLYAELIQHDIEYLNLPEVTEIISGDILFTIETIIDEISFDCPVSGTITKLNERLIDYPNDIKDDPEYENWVCKIKLNDNEEFSELMDINSYKSYFDDQRDEL